MMIEQKEAVIFDLDGTMTDSMWIWEEIDQDFFRQQGIPMPDNLHDEIEGMSFTETAQYFIRKYQFPQTVEEVKELWNRIALDKYVHETTLKPGLDAFLQLLKEKQIKIGIATSNSRLLLDAFLEARSLTGIIDAITTSCDVNKGKPEPDVYLKTAEKLGVSPEHCLVFEDIPMGILAGKRAGMTVCAVEDDYSAPLRAEKRRLADYYITDYRQVLDHTYEDLRGLK